MSLSHTVFWDIAKYLSKIADFNLPHLYLGPALRLTQLGFRRDLWHQQTRFPDLSYDIICIIAWSFSRPSRTPSCACGKQTDWLTDKRTDRQTDGRTHDDSQYLASIASRGYNKVVRTYECLTLNANIILSKLKLKLSPNSLLTSSTSLVFPSSARFAWMSNMQTVQFCYQSIECKEKKQMLSASSDLF